MFVRARAVRREKAHQMLLRLHGIRIRTLAAALAYALSFCVRDGSPCGFEGLGLCGATRGACGGAKRSRGCAQPALSRRAAFEQSAVQGAGLHESGRIRGKGYPPRIRGRARCCRKATSPSNSLQLPWLCALRFCTLSPPTHANECTGFEACRRQQRLPAGGRRRGATWSEPAGEPRPRNSAADAMWRKLRA